MKAEQLIAELEKALIRYGCHEDHCTNPPSFCDCGFADVLGDIIGRKEMKDEG